MTNTNLTQCEWTLVPDKWDGGNGIPSIKVVTIKLCSGIRNISVCVCVCVRVGVCVCVCVRVCVCVGGGGRGLK